jgi:hypothetical protein
MVLVLDLDNFDLSAFDTTVDLFICTAPSCSGGDSASTAG